MRAQRSLLPLTTALVLASLHAIGCGDDQVEITPPAPDAGPDATPRCEPSGGGPYWLLEGETVTFQIACGTGMELPGDAFAVGPLPDGATYDPVSRAVSFTPRLDQAAVYEVAVRVDQTNETGGEARRRRRLAGPGDAGRDPAHTEEYGLPCSSSAAARDRGLRRDGRVPRTTPRRRSSRRLALVPNSYDRVCEGQIQEPERQGA
jgi:hypothetical protein